MTQEEFVKSILWNQRQNKIRAAKKKAKEEKYAYIDYRQAKAQRLKRYEK